MSRKKNPNVLAASGGVRLFKELRSDGKEYNLVIEYLLGYYTQSGAGVRRRKQLKGLRLIAHPKTPEERHRNRETERIALAQWQVKLEMFLEDREGYNFHHLERRKVNFFDYFDGYIEHYQKKDIKMIKSARKRFAEFLAEHYPHLKDFIRPEMMNKTMMLKFADYLNSRGQGEGPRSILQRFKKVVRHALDDGLFQKDPCQGVRCIVDGEVLRKEILSQEEIKKLLNCEVPGQNREVRRAFIFSLYTGIRWCDVVDLTYRNVDYSNKLLKFEQKKTSGHSANSGVIINLSDGLLKLIGEPPCNHYELPIFTLPSHTMALKSLKRWIRHAGINKNITWHCARHSFAVNLLNNGANIKTVASLLGHSGLQHTEKYTRAVDSLKKAAIDSLPDLPEDLALLGVSDD